MNPIEPVAELDGNNAGGAETGQWSSRCFLSCSERDLGAIR